MTMREMRLYMISQIRDTAMVSAYFVRWMNAAYQTISQQYIIPRLNNGDPVALTQMTDDSGDYTNLYLCPYDFWKTIAFFDSGGRAMDVLPSEFLRQWNEYNAFGSFVQFYEQNQSNHTVLLDSGSTPHTIGIPNRSYTVTASAAIFTEAHEGQWLLPLDRNSTAGAGSPGDYGYLIDSTVGTTASPSTTCTLERPFRGVLSDSGSVGDLTTGYFEVRPNNTPIIRIWGNPGDRAYTINIEYQRQPSKLANDEDIPEDPRLSQALVHQAILMGAGSYRDAFLAKEGKEMLARTLGAYQTIKDFDKKLETNIIMGNPRYRSYSQLGGRHMGDMRWNDRGGSGIIY